MRERGRERGEVWPKGFSTVLGAPFFFSKYIQERFGIKKCGLFKRMYFNDDTLAKNGTTNISAVS